MEGHQEPQKSPRSHADGELAFGGLENAEDDTGFSSRLLADARTGSTMNWLVAPSNAR